MQFIRTKLASDWPEPSPTILKRAARFVVSRIDSNPDYEAKMQLVHQWLIGFDEEGLPWREIGIDKNGLPALTGPDARNYGFWLDTNMKIHDFTGEPVNEEEFERLWKIAGVREPA